MSDETRPLEPDPVIYLRDELTTPAERVLAEQIEQVSPAMMAAVAVRVHRHAEWMARRDGWERFAKRGGMLLTSLAVGNIAAVLAYWLHAHDARIVAEVEARAAASAEVEYRKGVNETIEQLRISIRQLQEKLMRMSGLQPDGPPGAGGVNAPDMPSSQRPQDNVSGTPASIGTSSGSVALHVPKLQNLQLGTSDVHSTLLRQSLPHELLGAGDGVRVPQPAMMPQIKNKVTLTMDTLYPWFRRSSKGIVP